MILIGVILIVLHDDMTNGWFIFNSRFSDVRADLRITSTAHCDSDAATGDDHGRSSQVNACFYTHRYVYYTSHAAARFRSIPESRGLAKPVASLLV